MTARGSTPPVAAAALLMLVTSCTGASSDRSDGRPAPSAISRPVIDRAEAKEVFAAYDRTNARADTAMDDAAQGQVQTGVLLKESLAAYQVHRKAGTKDEVAHLVRPKFLIPSEKADAGFPRFFAVLSKWKGQEKDRSSQLFYFAQTQPGGPWKATASIWALTEPLKKPSATDPAPGPTSTEKGRTIVRMKPKQLPALRRNPDDTVQLSPTGSAERSVCGAFADYLTFDPPQGKLADRRFARGPMTSDLVKFFNGWADPELERSLSYRPAGTALPVLRLDSGSSLVACTLQQTHRVAGVGASGTVVFEKDSDTQIMLGGGPEWREATSISSMTVLLEVPAKAGAAATVLSCDCYDPTLLSATGVR
ncbi:hypothetical protein GCM10010317_097280 [Streptomyces mirabilis]|nr:hypothetical protein GCM10010317_097280 [Streptomyces mirabilis]